MLKNKCSVWKRIKFPTFWYNCYYFTWSDTYFIQLETLLINHPSYLLNSGSLHDSVSVWQQLLPDYNSRPVFTFIAVYSLILLSPLLYYCHPTIISPFFSPISFLLSHYISSQPQLLAASRACPNENIPEATPFRLARTASSCVLRQYRLNAMWFSKEQGNPS